MLLQVTESWKLFCIWGRLVYWHVEIDLYLTVENWLFISVFIFMCINLCSLNCNKTTNSNLLILRKFHCNVLMKKKEYTLAGLLRQLCMNCRASGSIPSPSCMLECPWARHRIPYCSLCHLNKMPNECLPLQGNPTSGQTECMLYLSVGWVGWWSLCGYQRRGRHGHICEYWASCIDPGFDSWSGGGWGWKDRMKCGGGGADMITMT